jgi:hypothetical protein
MGFVISPETKVGDLLNEIPGAEEVLISIAPKFKALKNPVLRRTVAKVATLEQAARVAGMQPNELVRALREALGIAGGGDLNGAQGFSEGGPEPDWLSNEPAVILDADAMLGAGETPIAKVSSLFTELESGAVIAVSAGFEPAPMIDAVRKKGHEVYVQKMNEDDWTVWVRKS